MRGDRPISCHHRAGYDGFTPHARGSTLPETAHHLNLNVYPACAGIDPLSLLAHQAPKSLPRMRGDRPLKWIRDFVEAKFTPHARGSTATLLRAETHHQVYPACAGIDPGSTIHQLRNIRLPRMRGDRPLLADIFQDIDRFTPHARGSTPAMDLFMVHYKVYPACAGIDPICA